MKIIQKRNKFFVLSAILMIVSFALISTWGLKLGMDFVGGTKLTLKYEEGVPTNDEISEQLKELELGSLTIQSSEENTVFVRFVTGENDEEVLNSVQEKLKGAREDLLVEEVSYISSTVSGELKSRALTAIIFAVVGIALYVAWAFRKVSHPVESWKYGIAAVVALAHDTLLTVGLFSVLGHFYGIEVNIPFVAALLTILGYSVNDTIVVFDRVRENLNKSGAKDDFEETVNTSINESLTRSINTSLTVVVVLTAIILFGGESIQSFSIALLVGIVLGTYSSIFIASALIVEIWKKRN
ncbi:protein translocase subunit SecF [bacterium]|nr:protein translocase subunit SecF [bacterium]MBT4251195.1 protein translocase subunit SecF [bacterium]MBT4598013.1 protein translocase subunit SecF [bacterium]MBT6753574.1 protein translocase subunit SecF [bacterium]MBT7037689.1 protein translocase subunit SecF [bacterium]